MWLANDGIYDPWKGAAKVALGTTFDKYCITQSLYQEAGHHYLVEHPFSNPFVDVINFPNT